MSCPDDFAKALTKQAAARACVALGFKNADASVLEVLADVMRNYMEKIASCSLQLAELHGRVQPGLQDTLAALDNLKPNRVTLAELRDFALTDVGRSTSSTAEGATGAGAAAKTSSSYAASSAATELELGPEIDNETVASLKASASAWHQPFPHHVPDFPVRRKLKPEIRLPDELATRGRGVPAHLPPYPPVHTYKRSHGGSKKRGAAAAAASQTVSKAARSTLGKSLSLIEDASDHFVPGQA